MFAVTSAIEGRISPPLGCNRVKVSENLGRLYGYIPGLLDQAIVQSLASRNLNAPSYRDPPLLLACVLRALHNLEFVKNLFPL